MIHEHQTPMDNPIKWNKAIVVPELRKRNPNWSDEDIDRNMFEKYGDWQLCQNTKKLPDGPDKDVQLQEACEGRLVNGSKYDPRSVMHYFFPSNWMLAGPEITVNTKLSPTDIEWLRKMYGEEQPNYKEEEVSAKDKFMAFLSKPSFIRGIKRGYLILVVMVFSFFSMAGYFLRRGY
jgi:hypothetical protein